MEQIEERRRRFEAMAGVQPGQDVAALPEMAEHDEHDEHDEPTDSLPLTISR